MEEEKKIEEPVRDEVKKEEKEEIAAWLEGVMKELREMKELLKPKAEPQKPEAEIPVPPPREKKEQKEKKSNKVSLWAKLW